MEHGKLRGRGAGLLEKLEKAMGGEVSSTRHNKTRTTELVRVSRQKKKKYI